MKQDQFVDAGTPRCCVVDARTQTRTRQFFLKYIMAIHAKRVIFTKSVTSERFAFVHVNRFFAVSRQIPPSIYSALRLSIPETFNYNDAFIFMSNDNVWRSIFIR